MIGNSYEMYFRYGGLDILVNNAAFAFKKDATEPFAVQAEETVKVNYWSTKNVCAYLFPLLRQGARVVNVSSMAGWLREMLDDDAEVKKILSRDDLTAEQVDQVMKDFVASAKAGTHKEKGWLDNTYAASKIGLSALSVTQQKQFDQDRSKDIVVNHVHPGAVQTGMSSGRGTRTTDQGAEAPLFAARLPPNTEIRGQYLHEDCTVYPWIGKREFKTMGDLMKHFYPNGI